jgi:hypothetical protein
MPISLSALISLLPSAAMMASLGGGVAGVASDDWPVGAGVEDVADGWADWSLLCAKAGATLMGRAVTLRTAVVKRRRFNISHLLHKKGEDIAKRNDDRDATAWPHAGQAKSAAHPGRGTLNNMLSEIQVRC